MKRSYFPTYPSLLPFLQFHSCILFLPTFAQISKPHFFFNLTSDLLPFVAIVLFFSIRLPCSHNLFYSPFFSFFLILASFFLYASHFAYYLSFLSIVTKSPPTCLSRVFFSVLTCLNQILFPFLSSLVLTRYCLIVSIPLPCLILHFQCPCYPSFPSTTILTSSCLSYSTFSQVT